MIKFGMYLNKTAKSLSHVSKTVVPALSHLLNLQKQEAQLSQRDRATLHVFEYFAKLLQITQGHSK